ncbi:hypothetical protein C5167_031889, partial [Papaver somniferum]
MSSDMEENYATSSAEENSLDVEENSQELEMIEAFIDMPPQELERTVQDALNDMLSPELERPVQHAIIDVLPQELETQVQIFVIPSHVKKRNPKAYQPKMVSIGPYHYSRPQLKPMQSHKKRAVTQFLKRSPTTAKETYLNELMQVYDKLWKSYEQVPELHSWTPENFIKLMMVDGIFILEFLGVVKGNRNGNDYVVTDLIFGKQGHILNYSYVMDDLLLLENQVPYLVLSTLLTVSEGLSAEETKNYLARLMLAPTTIEGHHLLDMYITGTLGGRECQEPIMGESVVKVSAAELTKTYRITFKPVATYKDMKFSRRSKTVKLPTIIIDEGTICRFYNMKTYQLVGDTRIIASSFASDEAVISVMKELTRDTIIMADNIDDKSAAIIKEVVKYYENKTR